MPFIKNMHREIRATPLLDLFDHLHEEPRPVLHALWAVLVIALVPKPRQECVEEVIAACVDLNPIPSRLLQPRRARGKPLHQAVNLPDGQRMRRLLIMHVERRRIRHCRRSHRLRRQRINPAPRPAMIQLRKYWHPVFMHLCRQFLQLLEILVVVNPESPVAFFQQRPLHRRCFGDHQSRTATRHCAIKRLRTRAHPVLPGFKKVSLGRRLHDPVLQLYLPDVRRGKQQLIFVWCGAHSYNSPLKARLPVGSKPGED